MKLSIPYNGLNEEISIPDRNLLAVVSPKEAAVRDEASLILDSINRPIASNSFEAFLSEDPEPLVLVNDATRSTPTAKILDVLLPRLPKGTRFLVASGTHPAQDDDDLRFIFKKHYKTLSHRIFTHDSKADDLVLIGRTSAGTDVRINKLAAAARKLLVIGSVEPHYFAGFTGGRKAFLPGVSAYGTVERNHRFANEPGSSVMRLSGNPVHEDMSEAAKLIPGGVFSIQCVLDKNNRIAGVYSGGLEASFDSAVRCAAGIFSAAVPSKADLVIAVAEPPLDVDLYQAHKALENSKDAVTPGGMHLAVAACPKGVGNDAFVRLFEGARNPDDVIQRLSGPYKLGAHKTARIVQLLKNSRIGAVSGINPMILEMLFIRPYSTVQSAVDETLARKPDAKVLVVLDAGVVVPHVEIR
jgi:lactate racemase